MRIPASKSEQLHCTATLLDSCASYLSARTATRMHRSGSRSGLAWAASNNLAHLTSPLEMAKKRGVFLRSP